MSFISGDIGEGLWIDHLESLGHKCKRAPKRVFYDWDIKSTYSLHDSIGEFTWEIKYDRMAYAWAERRGTPNKINAYIEFENTNQGLPSGIAMSRADYYVYIVRVAGDLHHAYVFKTDELRKHLQHSDYKVVGNKSGGDDNANGWLLPLNEVSELGHPSGFMKKVELKLA